MKNLSEENIQKFSKIHSIFLKEGLKRKVGRINEINCEYFEENQFYDIFISQIKQINSLLYPEFRYNKENYLEFGQMYYFIQVTK